MEKLFRKIADKEGAELVLKHETAYSPFIMSPLTRKEMGTQIKSLSLNLKYKQYNIAVTYLLGNDQKGMLTCQIDLPKNLPEFQITSTNAYWRLINRRLKAIRIKSDDKEFTSHFENVLFKLNLEKIASTTQFEPQIIGSNKNKIFEITTDFYLGFSHKKEVLKPLIAFYKALIDYELRKIDKH